MKMRLLSMKKMLLLLLMKKKTQTKEVYLEWAKNASKQTLKTALNEQAEKAHRLPSGCRNKEKTASFCCRSLRAVKMH